MKQILLILLSGAFFISSTTNAAENNSSLTTEISIVSVEDYAWRFSYYRQTAEKDKYKSRYEYFTAKSNEYNKEIDKLTSLKKSSSSNIKEIDNKINILKDNIKRLALSYKTGMEKDREILQKLCYEEMADIASKMRYDFVIDPTITCESEYTNQKFKAFPYVSEKLNKTREIFDLIRSNLNEDKRTDFITETGESSITK